MHSLAVKEVPVGFSVTARSPEGAIEAIESDSGNWLAVGIQFLPHPGCADLDLRLFRAFVGEVVARERQPAET
jgi:gamma-glutamyl-gamma-aminobutyrate hydrolase PuuD